MTESKLPLPEPITEAELREKLAELLDESMIDAVVDDPRALRSLASAHYAAAETLQGLFKRALVTVVDRAWKSRFGDADWVGPVMRNGERVAVPPSEMTAAELEGFKARASEMDPARREAFEASLALAKV